MFFLCFFYNSGDIEGFVDLGGHTPADQKNVLADHGMIVLFQPFTGKLFFSLGYSSQLYT